MLDSAWLLTLATIVREGCFERAARVLQITPSAVSQRIRQLEERVGTVLLVRGQPCIATETGARLCRHAETVTLMERQLARDVPGLQAAAIGPDGRQEPTPITLRIALNADSLATWFVGAMFAFAQRDGVLLDISVDDQDKTSEALRRGQVLAAVTSLAQPVQGCRSRKLGSLRYVASAAPAFVARWFANGVTAEALARAPTLVFDRNDRLQENWVRRQVRKDLPLLGHRLPSTQGFVDAALSGIGWGMNPWPLVQQHLATGRLVELVPGRHLDVPLYWQVSQLEVPELDWLTSCVMDVAKASLVA